MRALTLPVVLALSTIPPVGAHAEPLNALAAGGRYQLMDVNDKIVRLDTKTGRFDLCHMEADDWTCVATRDQRAELEARIAELTRRVETLEAARMTDVPAPVAIQQAPQPQQVGTGTEFEQVADVVPPVEVGRTPGKPMVIAPAPPAPEKSGIVKRITGWIPGLGG